MSTPTLVTERASRMKTPVVLAIHDPVAYRKGGLVKSAQRVAKAGRYGDTILVHLHPEELDELRAHWGEPTINPHTGLPEYFLKRLAKKAKKFTKRLLKNPIVGALAPIAMNILLPGVGGLIGQSLFGAARASATGGNPFLGAALGAGTHFMGGGNAKGPNAQVGSAGGAAGAAGAGIAPGEGPLGQLPADGVGPPAPVGATGGSAGPLSKVKDFYTTDAGKPAWGKIATTGGALLGGLGAMASQPEETGPPPRDPRMEVSLPNLTFDRSRMPVQNYYTYGQGGGGEQSFFDANRIPSVSAEPQEGMPDLASLLTPDEMMKHIRGFQDGGGVRGPGSGRSDDIPAQLSDGEYVIDAESVALLGDGSVDEGARRLDQMRRNLRRHKAQNLAKGQFSHSAKSPEAYMAGAPKRRAKGGRIRGDWVQRVVEGGKDSSGRPKVSDAERQLRLRQLQRLAETLRQQKPHKAKGGRVDPVLSRRRLSGSEVDEIARRLRRLSPDSDVLRIYDAEKATKSPTDAAFKVRDQRARLAPGVR